MWIEKKDEEQEDSQTNTLGDESVGAGAGTTPIKPQGSSTAATGNLSSTQPDPTAPGQKFGTIQDYFKASKAQGDELGRQFASRLDESRQQQQQQIGEAAESAKGQVQSGIVGYDQDLITRAVTDPTKVAGDEGEFSKFMQQWDAAYKGPQSFEQTSDYEKAAKAAGEAKAKGEQVGTAGGRQELLRTDFGVQGAGGRGLDEALIQQSSSFADIGQKGKELTALQDYLGSKSQEVGTEAQKAKETTEQTKQKTQEALLGEKGAVREFKSDIDARTAAERIRAEQEQKDLATAFQNRSALSDTQLQQLGITRQQYNDLLQKEKTAGYTNLQDYLKFQNPNAQISRETVASQADQAKDAAFAQLTGGSKLLGATREGGKLVDFDKDTALQSYLDKIGADETERERARLEREAQQRAEQEQRDAEETAKREGRQNEVLGTVLMPGSQLFGNEVSRVIGEGANKVIDNIPLARDTISAVDKNVTQPVVNTVKSIANTVKSVFCFDGLTMIDMVDGSKKAIKDIQLGDRVKGGGEVQSIRTSRTPNGTRFDYKGIIVTGSHAVKEKSWLRVRNSTYARRIDGDGIVYSLVTDLHRIYVNGIQFADEHETDMYESLSMEESLRYLNRTEKVHFTVC